MGTIYILKHKNPKFSGYQLGVGFHEGRGATSSDRDARILIEKGICKDTTKEEEAKRKKVEALAKAREVKKVKAEALKKSKEEKKAKDEAKKEGKETAKEEEEPKVEEKK